MGLFGNKELQALVECLNGVRDNIAANGHQEDPASAPGARSGIAQAETLIDRLKAKGKGVEARKALEIANNTPPGIVALGATPAAALSSLESGDPESSSLVTTSAAWHRIIEDMILRTQ